VAIESDPDKKMDIQEYLTSDEFIQTEVLLKHLDEKSALAKEILEQIKDIHTLLVDESNN